MSTRLADRLHAARQQQFVGREAELAAFDILITAPALPYSVLYVYGPGGVGKTTLLQAFRARCQGAHIPTAEIDGRNVEASPASFLQALGIAMGLTQPAAPIAVLAQESRRYVILIDTYESLAPLDRWLRDTFLPEISDQVLIVLAGTRQPAPAWRSDLGWQSLLRSLALRNLSPEESRRYLSQRKLPDDQHEPVLELTHGHPLALSLVADVFAQREDVQFQPEFGPDIIKTLLERFVQKVPGPAHRAALEACAVVRLMTETVLSEMLGMADVHELFDWLRGLAFIELAPHGVFPHDLARDALTADLRWRNPAWFAELHRRARAYYHRSLHQQGNDQRRVLFDYVYLHRNSPLVRPFLEWKASDTGQADQAAEQDIPALLDMVAQHEGTESARLAAHWFTRQPHNVIVYRDAKRQPTGFLQIVTLHDAQPSDIAADPATRAAWEYLQGHAPLRNGEVAAMFRFWMARDSYQAVSAVQSFVFLNVVQYCLNAPGLAFTLFTCASPTFWAPPIEYMDLARLHACDFTVGNRTYGVFGHDWRVVPPLAWLDLLAEREIATAPMEKRPQTSPTSVVLSQPAFESAVRDALHDLSHPDILRSNPLLRSRLVLEETGPTASDYERVAKLQALLRRAVEGLQNGPREMKWYRAVYHTYLQPAATQEQAAEILDVPFSSYRRHLKAGIGRIAETLWQWELQGSET